MCISGRDNSGSVFTNHSWEHSQSCSPECPMIRSIWKQHNFWLAKPYGLANQKLCYIQIYKSWRKRQRTFLEMFGEYEPWSLVLTLSQTTNFRLFQTERVSRRQFQIWWKWQKVLQTSKKPGKRINCSLRAIYPFPTVFSKDLYSRHVKTRACLGKGWMFYTKNWSFFTNR